MELLKTDLTIETPPGNGLSMDFRQISPITPHYINPTIDVGLLLV